MKITNQNIYRKNIRLNDLLAFEIWMEVPMQPRSLRVEKYVNYVSYQYQLKSNIAIIGIYKIK